MCKSNLYSDYKIYIFNKIIKKNSFFEVEIKQRKKLDKKNEIKQRN